MQQPLAFIPSPSQGSIHLGPLPLRGYALMIIIGVIIAVWLGDRRWAARGGTAGTVLDIAVWAVPFGLVGGRLYHVITDHQLYFGHGRHPVDALKVWNGGLGIWGAIALGALGAYIGCRRRGISLRVFADAAAPGIALAQAMGRWGNWFNQELYGRPSKLPWAVKIDPAHRPPDAKYADIATYQPTFLYECLWCIGVAILVIWAEKRFRLAYGRTFALYVAAYTVGRAWIEWLRIDEAHHILGLRLNDWTCLIVFLGAVAYMYLQRHRTENPPGALGTVSDAGEAVADPAEPATADGDTATATTTTAIAEPADSEAVLEPGSEPEPEPEPAAAAPAVADAEAADPEDTTAAEADATPPEAKDAGSAEAADAEAEGGEPADDDRTEVAPATATGESAAADKDETADARTSDAEADAEEVSQETAPAQADPAGRPSAARPT
ncbi:prolipoprotein diacylglyceryl transferase [Actinoallomurus rhizosphaericola]|uniref:prolipoprotein diacylglyceryl transferase n=1 Tax=Actinoallomurus rhizosphaericola TaxID=2952536 RepID=UPI002093F8EB|nr:prolipoprotein diacylglyceryl transferase [Actinoallomurus rhizosphaericola]MCO5999649.1 prolipoprotein diacylglyceryl transferase [Actinoallomurus rhizosphaericola]